MLKIVKQGKCSLNELLLSYIENIDSITTYISKNSNN